MKRFLTKIISTGLCATTLSLSSFIIPAYAAESTTAATETGEYHKFVPSILKPEIKTIPKDHAYIPQGTKFPFELTQTVDSKTAHTGDPILFKISSNIIVNNVIVIPEGTIANGIITKARSAGGMGRRGKIEFSINSIKTINNVDIPLSYDSKVAGQGDGGAVAVFAAVSIIGGLFMKGSNVQCTAGTKINIPVTTDTDLNVTLDGLADAMDTSKAHGVSIELK